MFVCEAVAWLLSHVRYLSVETVENDSRKEYHDPQPRTGSGRSACVGTALVFFLNQLVGVTHLMALEDQGFGSGMRPQGRVALVLDPPVLGCCAQAALVGSWSRRQRQQRVGGKPEGRGVLRGLDCCPEHVQCLGNWPCHLHMYKEAREHSTRTVFKHKAN